MRSLTTALFVTVCAALSGCEQVRQFQQSVGLGGGDTGTVGSAMSLFEQVPESEEIAIGQEISATLLGAAALSTDQAKQRYVNQVGLWLAEQTERSDLPWRFGVLDTPAINAFAAPGGYVFVTAGLLDLLSTEAELAGVLAHEIAHVLKRHHLRAVKQDKAISLIGELGEAAAERSGHADALPDSVKESIGNVARALYAKGLNRADEYDADQVGAVLMARAGYNPYAFASVLHKLSRVAGADPGAQLLFETHPAPSDRLDQIAELLEGPLSGGAYAELQGRYQKFMP